MIKTVIKAEFRNIIRDRMYTFFMVYPIIMGTIGYFLIPYIEEQDPGTIWGKVLAMFFIIITGYIFGALTAFTLLDDKDDSVLMSLKITPISVQAYVKVKLTVSFIFGFIATIAIIYGTGFIAGASIGTVLLIATLGALQAPGVALIVNSFAENKVEGFVIMKLSGLILILPVLAFFISGAIQNILGIAPGYWAARIIELELVPSEQGSALLTFLAGVSYNLILTWLLLKLYTKKANL